MDPSWIYKVVIAPSVEKLMEEVNRLLLDKTENWWVEGGAGTTADGDWYQTLIRDPFPLADLNELEAHEDLIDG